MAGARNCVHGRSGLNLWCVGSLVIALAGCQRGQEGEAKAVDATNPGAGVAAETGPAVLPWRYGPALAAAVMPAGVAAEPVLEVADGLRGRARIVVAVAQGEAPVRLEIWDFSQNNPRDRLERVDAPVVLLDLDPAATAVADEVLAGLRREMASPASESSRVVGLAVKEASELPAELARLAAEATGKGEGRARALAQFTHGLDDHLLWSGRLAELLQRLARGAWEIGEVTPVGARRVRMAAREGERALRLELARSQERWVLTDVSE